MKRRILFITPSLRLPADSSQLRLLATGLADRQFDVHIAAICDPVGSPTRIHQATLHSLGIGQPHPRHRAVYHSVKLAAVIRTLLESLRPDVVHSWDADARLELAWASRFLPSAARIDTTTYLSGPRTHARQLTHNYVAPYDHSVVIPHETLTEHLVDNGCPEKQIVVIPPAVPCESKRSRTEAKERTTACLGLPSSIYLASTVAPLHPRFRLKDLIWATDLLTCIRDDFHLLIVGLGEQKARLKKFASQTEAGSHVHILDRPPKQLTPTDLFLGSDVYWNANLHTPLSSPMLHAMAASTPVISVLGNGTSDLIRHQETGFAVNFGARDEFARWTKYLIEQPESAHQLSHQGKSYAIDNFSVDDAVEAYANLYHSKLSGGS